MPRHRSYRRGRVGTASIAAPQAGSLLLSASVLALTATAGAASASYDSDAVTVRNAGPGSLHGPQVAIAYGSGSAWLTLTLTADNAGTLTLTPSIDASALAAATYTATITVTDTNASNSGQTIGVTLTVNADSPTIKVFPSAMTLSIVDETASGTAATTTISNIGGGTLDVPTIGTITGTGAAYIASAVVTGASPGPYTLTVTPTATGGTVGGPYTATIPLLSTGARNSPVTFPVNVTVTAAQQAILSVDRSLDDSGFTVGGANPADQTVGIRNVGAGVLAGPTVQSTSYAGSFSGWATPTISNNTLTVAIDASGIAIEGTATVTITIADANASNTVTYSVYLRSTAAVVTPTIVLSPSTVLVGAQVGNTAPSTTVQVSNANGTVSQLGTVSVSLGTAVAWVTPTYNATSGQITLTFTSSALAAGTYSTTLIVTASLAGNSPVSTGVNLTMSAVSAGTYPPGPQVAALPLGWSYNRTVGYFEGSCFNSGGYASAANGAMPTFAGTEHIVTNASELSTALSTCVDGDIITITAGGTYSNVQLPKRTGWVEGTSGFVWIRTSGHALLPTYQSSRGPNVFTAANRCTDADLANLVTFQTAQQGVSAVCPQQGAGGWWMTGIRFLNSYTNATYQPTVVVNSGGHVGTSYAQSLDSHTPSHIVFDRCLVRATQNPSRAVFAGARYSVWSQCSLPDTYKNNTEPQAFNFLNGGARTDILGCSFSGFGEHILSGGGNPPIQNFNPTDVMVAWNYAWIDVAATGALSDDNKNAFEMKTGGRFCFAFNKIDGQSFKADQKFALLTKGTDQTEIVNGVKVQAVLFPAHTYDILFWCNDLGTNVKKGFFQIADEVSDVASSATIGTERIEIAWNKHFYDVTVPSTYNPSRSERQAMSWYKSQGDGSPDVWLYHNTFGGGQSFWTGDPTNVGGTGWLNLAVFNNVMNEQPQYGPFFGGSSGSNTAGLNSNFGTGNWSCRRNFVPPGGAQWDTGLTGGSNLNGYLHSANLGSVFANLTGRDFTLVGAPSASYYDGIAYGGGYQTTAGYSETYMAEMLAGVSAD